MRLSVIIVNWNVKTLVCRAVAAVLKNPPDLSYEIIVIDNASTDGSAEELERLFGGRIKLLRSPRNV
ncbi:MAG: glycosyltransferase, partial [Candidatus Margulisbacteria bacterium]|nr:glycosyltransferase [Candidatus Margulisiibacteriota bacterium]